MDEKVEVQEQKAIKDKYPKIAPFTLRFQGNEGKYDNFKIVVWKRAGDKKLKFTIKEFLNHSKNPKLMARYVFRTAQGYYPKSQRYFVEFELKKDKEKYNIYYNSEKPRENFLKQNKGSYNKKIVAYGTDGYAVGEFKNMFEALLWLRIYHVTPNAVYDPRTIIMLAKKKEKYNFKTAHGFKWFFAEDLIKSKH